MEHQDITRLKWFPSPGVSQGAGDASAPSPGSCATGQMTQKMGSRQQCQTAKFVGAIRQWRPHRPDVWGSADVPDILMRWGGKSFRLRPDAAGDVAGMRQHLSAQHGVHGGLDRGHVGQRVKCAARLNGAIPLLPPRIRTVFDHSRQAFAAF